MLAQERSHRLWFVQQGVGVAFEFDHHRHLDREALAPAAFNVGEELAGLQTQHLDGVLVHGRHALNHVQAATVFGIERGRRALEQVDPGLVFRVKIEIILSEPVGSGDAVAPHVQ